MDEDRFARLNRLRWQSRRALLELDLMLEKFWHGGGEEMDEAAEVALRQLLALDDYDLWALVIGMQEIQDVQQTQVIARIRAAR